MTQFSEDAEIRSLHQLWSSMTGLKVVMDMQSMQCWRIWIAAVQSRNKEFAEFVTAEDALKAVLRWHMTETSKLGFEDSRQAMRRRFQNPNELCYISHSSGAVAQIQKDISNGLAESRNRLGARRPASHMAIWQPRGPGIAPTPPEDHAKPVSAILPKIPVPVVIAAMREAAK